MIVSPGQKIIAGLLIVCFLMGSFYWAVYEHSCNKSGKSEFSLDLSKKKSCLTDQHSKGKTEPGTKGDTSNDSVDKPGCCRDIIHLMEPKTDSVSPKEELRNSGAPKNNPYHQHIAPFGIFRIDITKKTGKVAMAHPQYRQKGKIIKHSGAQAVIEKGSWLC